MRKIRRKATVESHPTIHEIEVKALFPIPVKSIFSESAAMSISAIEFGMKSKFWLKTTNHSPILSISFAKLSISDEIIYPTQKKNVTKTHIVISTEIKCDQICFLKNEYIPEKINNKILVNIIVVMMLFHI